MIKLLLGGSPCTYWSIAQKNNRETEPSGLGWDLFENYLIAKEKFKPDYFLYENNKSAAQAIKDEIKNRLNVWDGSFLTDDSGARYIEINSALVSAQNRQRFYVHNCGDVEQPEDRGILLRDILERGEDLSQNEKSYCLTSSYDGAVAWNTIERKQRTMVAEPIGTTKDGKAFVLTANYSNGSGEKIGNYAAHTIEKACKTMVAEPVCVQEQVYGRTISCDGTYDRRYEAREDGKCGTLTATNRQNAIAEPIRIPEYSSEKSRPVSASYANKGTGGSLLSDCLPVNKNKQVFDYIAEPVRIGSIENSAKNREYDSKQYRVYSPDGKSTTLCGQGGGMGAKTGLYAIPVNTNKGKSQTIKAQYANTSVANICCYTSTYGASGVAIPTKSSDKQKGNIYEVKDGKITIKGKQYPIKLKDGYYIIRKLTVTECCRLQTLPDDFCRAVSASHGYKGCGNGWTAEVIIHILSHALKNVPKDEKIVVLSMYDGIGTGRYCLDKMGFTNVEYYASEIDKYAMQIAMSNYPDIIQLGDAFQVRDEKWSLEK